MGICQEKEAVTNETLPQNSFDSIKTPRASPERDPDIKSTD